MGQKIRQICGFSRYGKSFSEGHQDYSRDALNGLDSTSRVFEEDVRQTVELKKIYEAKYGRKIRLFVAGWLFTHEDGKRTLSLGADGVQVGTCFIVTEECDAAKAYKQAFANANTEDLLIIESPV